MNRFKKALVIGASGFLGSHLVRELVKKNYTVKILVRSTSNVDALTGIDYEKTIGDVLDRESLKKAMQGCEYVFHSAVNPNAWIIDSGPLYLTNVMGVMNSVMAAKSTDVERFILTSSFITIGNNGAQPATEENYPSNDDLFTEYIRTRYIGEKYVLDEFNDNGFPGIAGCVSNTYGPLDIQPTAHGNLIKQVARGKVPYYFNSSSECVGVIDAAKALILAAEKGRPGERYIISEKYVNYKDLFTIAAKHACVTPPKFAVPKRLLWWLASLSEALNRLSGYTSPLTKNSVIMIHRTFPVSNQKAINELNWQPEPIEKAIKAAVDFYLNPL